MSQKDYPAELLESMDALSRLVTSNETVGSTVARIAELAVLAIDPAEECGISLAANGHIRSIAVTDPVCKKIDEIQTETGEGPCNSSIEHHATFYIANMAEDETWPRFSARVAEATGICSLLAYVLEVSDESLGAMLMMSRQPDAFDDHAINTGAIFAAQAAVALANAQTHEKSQQKVEQLEEGIRTRQVIGEAVGIVMATRQVDADRAFDILKGISQHTNVKLKEIAAGLVQRVDEL